MANTTKTNAILLNLARSLTQQGWSVIPLRGDADPLAPKAPALPSWKLYQGRIPTDSELVRWFVNQRFSALGVVLGRVSRLIVIDIDDPVQAERFQAEFPDLTETFTVSSGNRQLPHYYFSLPSDVVVTPRNHAGIELRSDGQYVVAPLVSINNKTWEITNPVHPKLLTKSDLRRLLSFFRLSTYQSFEKSLKTPSDAILTPSSIPSLIARYHRLADKHGRNNALFYTACYARDRGWTQYQVQQALSHVHATKPAVSAHPTETRKHREYEAQRTIASAFSRPARQPHNTHKVYQLPNAVREILLQMRLDNVARVLDGLMMAGFEPGQQFTVKTAYQALQLFGIGRNTLIDVLKSYPSPQPPHPANAATRYADETKKCFFGRVANSVKTPGRPAQIYIMPSIGDLCDLLDVQPKGCDPLSPADLQSPAAYRAALHAALIRRAPGKYSRRWQARRLGISKDTCRRYERQKKIATIPTFQDTQVRFFNVHQVIPDEASPGQFIQDEAGKRYPAQVRLAQKLLKKGKRLIFRRQDVNYYFVPDAVDLSKILEVTNAQLTQLNLPGFDADSPIEIAAYLPGIEIVIVEPHSQTASVSVTNTEPRSNSQVAKHALKMTKQRASADDDLAEVVYQTLRRLNPTHAMTRKRAKALVRQFPPDRIRRGLSVIQRRSNIYNPAGFLQTWLKCSGTEHFA
ncbi:MAG: hypothetical protein D6711_00390 [Chloroflexi bacterium]|nr:MAG: hypothetical protein D6711_00390 [Chloroflexota bacterium]